MSPKDQAQHLSEALRKVQEDIHFLEHEAYYHLSNKDKLKRLYRVQRALSHDLAKLVKTIPAPVQYTLFSPTAVDAPRVAASRFSEQERLKNDRGDLTPDGAETL